MFQLLHRRHRLGNSLLGCRFMHTSVLVACFIAIAGVAYSQAGQEVGRVCRDQIQVSSQTHRPRSILRKSGEREST